MKVARFAIFFTGMIGLTMGGILCISSLQTQQEEALLRTNENLKSQAQVFTDQFNGIIETVKNTSDASSLPYVTHCGVAKLNQGVPSEIESLDQVKSLNSESGVGIDLAFEERVLKALKNQVTLGELMLSKIAVGTFDLSEVGSKEGIFLVTLAPAKIIPAPVIVPSTDPQAQNNISEKIVSTSQSKTEKINIFLIDPVRAMSSLMGFRAEDKNAFLMNKNGRVLVHSNPAFIGTDLRKISTLKETLASLFLGAQTGNVGHYLSVEGVKENIALVRASTLPFAVAVEQKASYPVLSLPWWSEQYGSGAARKNLGVLFLVLAGALSLFSFVSIWLNRELKKQMKGEVSFRERNQSSARAETSLSLTPIEGFHLLKNPKLEVPVDEGSMAISRAAEQFVENRTLINDEIEKLDYTKQKVVEVMPRPNLVSLREAFSKKIQNAFNAETIEKELVETCTALTESPTLFFRYHRLNQNLILTTVGGEVAIPNYSSMQAYVRKDIEQQVERLATEGKVASVTHYGPIHKLMLSNLNVAHYEAWAVTSEREISQGSKMVGILIVLQAGFKSSEVRPQLAKILKEAGSALQAQNSRIRTKQDSTRIKPSDRLAFEPKLNS